MRFQCLLLHCMYLTLFFSAILRKLLLRRSGLSWTNIFAKCSTMCTPQQEVSKFHYTRRKYKLVRPTKRTLLRPFPRTIPAPSYVANPTTRDASDEIIELKNEEQIENMRRSCRLAREILDATAENIKVFRTSQNRFEV